jgi:hypothetical protein
MKAVRNILNGALANYKCQGLLLGTPTSSNKIFTDPNLKFAHSSFWVVGHALRNNLHYYFRFQTHSFLFPQILGQIPSPTDYNLHCFETCIGPFQVREVWNWTSRVKPNSTSPHVNNIYASSNSVCEICQLWTTRDTYNYAIIWWWYSGRIFVTHFKLVLGNPKVQFFFLLWWASLTGPSQFFFFLLPKVWTVWK